MSARRLAAGSAFALACALGLAPRSARANPMDMYGLGSRSIGMGGGVSADVQDASANYYNPGGLVRGSALRMELGYFHAHHALTANSRDNQVDPARGIVLGLVAPARIFGIPFALGLVTHVPDERLARSRLLSESQPRWLLYDNRVQRLYFAANIAVAPVPWLRLGGGFSLVASTRALIGLQGDVPVASPRDAVNAQLQHTIDADVRAVYYPQLGAQVDVLHNLTVSMVYRGEFRFRLDLDAQLDLNLVVGRLDDPQAVRAAGTIGLQTRAVTAFLPQQAVLGAAWEPVSGLKLVADVTWVDWSSYVDPTAAVVVDVNFERPPGSENLPLPNIPPPTQPMPLHFHDTFVPRVGAEFRHAFGSNWLAARVGYRYDPSPVPDQRGVTNFMDCTRHVIAAGLGWTARGEGDLANQSVTVDIHADVQLLEGRTVLKDDPANSVSDYVIGGQVFNLGVTLATTF